MERKWVERRIFGHIWESKSGPSAQKAVQCQIQGSPPPPPPLLLLLDQTEARRAETIFFDNTTPPPAPQPPAQAFLGELVFRPSPQTPAQPRTTFLSHS